ncbi:dihydrolipoyl dehydrogenase family protein [Nitrospira sp. NS4]|uniref:dihydrolipoyl dehydrogenase family protein n=1 Tax=Nitrospira sp. NS4 TaxID=3414498 RepID=UPI003C2AD571
MATQRVHDVIVIGGGSAGYAAARTAREAGADVAIVDRGPLGGLCILRGCMPTKTILRSAEIAALMRRAPEFGLAPVDVRAALSAIVDRKERLVREFADYRIQQLRDPGYTLYEAPASFLSPHLLQVGNDLLTAKAFIIATGSVPRQDVIPDVTLEACVTSDTLLERRDQPESLIVLGAGPVGLEFAQFFARIGTAVTIVQRSAHVLSHLDADVGAAVGAALEEEGLSVMCGAQVRRVGIDGGKPVVRVSRQGTEQTLSGELVLNALGRVPDIAGLNLPAAGVRVDEGRVVVDGAMRTSQPHMFAVGDVTNLYDVVHIAIQQGELAGWNACHPEQAPKSFDDRLVTEVIFTDPQVAVVGLTEKACRRRGIPYLTGSYPFADHGKAMCLGATHGFVKLVAEPSTGALLGAQIVGPEAGELIHELIAVMYYRGTVHDLLRMPHYHPTLAEIVTYPAESIAEQLKA